MSTTYVGSAEILRTDPCPACVAGQAMESSAHVLTWDCHGRGPYGACGSRHCRTCAGMRGDGHA